MLAAEATLRSEDGVVIDRRCVAEEERVLVERAKTDPSAFGELYDRHVNSIYAYAMRCLREPMAAEDVVAETFERALMFLARYQWRGAPFRAWLYSIASNAIAGRVRSQWPTVRLDAAAEPLDDDLGPEEAALRSERRCALMAALATLSLGQQQVVLLRYGADLALKDIATAIGRSEGATKALLFRAQRALRRRLASSRPH